MRPTASLLSCLVLVAATGCQQGQGGGASSEPKTDEQKTFYALGMIVANQIKVFNLKPDELNFVVAGLRDGVSDKKPAIEMSAFGPKVNQLAQERAKAHTAEEKKAGLVVLEAAAKESGAEKLPSGVIYKSIKEGTGASPAATDRVKVHYHGTLRDGKVFDSSVERKQPASFELNHVVPCWTEGVQKMKVGGKAKLTCPPESAYGERPQGKIPAGSTLTFEVELLEIEPPAAAPAPGAATPGMPPGMKMMPGLKMPPQGAPVVDAHPAKTPPATPPAKK